VIVRAVRCDVVARYRGKLEVCRRVIVSRRSVALELHVDAGAGCRGHGRRRRPKVLIPRARVPHEAIAEGDEGRRRKSTWTEN
jgi:hypothetical protein